MVTSSNPAARLHTIFSRYVSSYTAEQSLVQIWGKAMGGNGARESRARLVTVVELMSELRRQLLALERPAYLEMFDDIQPTLLDSILLPVPASTSAQTAGQAAIPPSHLKTLAGLAGILEDANMGLARLDDDTSATIRAEINEALEAVRTDSGLPVDVRRAIIARLHDILWALDHLDTGGPEAAVAAAERLGFLWSRVDEKHHTSGAFVAAMNAAGATWGAFLFAAESIRRSRPSSSRSRSDLSVPTCLNVLGVGKNAVSQPQTRSLGGR